MKRLFALSLMVAFLVGACAGAPTPTAPVTQTATPSFTQVVTTSTQLPASETPESTFTPHASPTLGCGSYNYVNVKAGTTNLLTTNGPATPAVYLFSPKGAESGLVNENGVVIFVSDQSDAHYYLFVVNTSGGDLTLGGNSLLQKFYDNSRKDVKIASWMTGKEAAITLKNMNALVVANVCDGTLMDPQKILTEIYKQTEKNPKVIMWARAEYDGSTFTITNYGQAPE